MKHWAADVLLRPAIRAFVTMSGETSLLKVAAASGWWKLPRSVLETVAEECGWRLRSDFTLFEVLWLMTKSATGADDDGCMIMLRGRMSTLLRSTQLMEDVLTIDEAAQCLREEDRKDVTDEQKKAVAKEFDVARPTVTRRPPFHGLPPGATSPRRRCRGKALLRCQPVTFRRRRPRN